MSSNYHKIWSCMNDLEMITAKIVSAKEIISVAAEAIQNNDYNKAETLAIAANEFLDYYLQEFDRKFKIAWDEIVVKQKEETVKICDLEDTSEYCTGSWNDFWNNTEDTIQDKKYNAQYSTDKWIIPVEEDNLNGDLFITFPEDLIQKLGWNGNDTLKWIDNEDGTWTVKKS